MTNFPDSITVAGLVSSVPSTTAGVSSLSNVAASTSAGLAVSKDRLPARGRLILLSKVEQLEMTFCDTP